MWGWMYTTSGFLGERGLFWKKGGDMLVQTEGTYDGVCLEIQY